MTDLVEFRSIHDLPFESRPWVRNPHIQEFRIGTCFGQWFVYDWPKYRAYVILTVINDNPGNGHFEDVLQWFEQSARRDRYALEVWEIGNNSLYHHLVNKRGFKPMKRKGNEDPHVTKFP